MTDTLTQDRKFWNKIATKYSTQPISDPEAYELTLTQTARQLKPTDTVVELGAGTASTALRLAPQVHRIVATDISDEMTRIGSDKARAAGTDNVQCLTATSDDPRLPAIKPDVVMTFNFLHLVSDLEQTLTDIHRMLAPGGLFISKTPCLRDGLRFIAPLLPVMRLFGKAPNAVQFFGAEELEAALRWAGFDILEADNHGSPRPTKRFLVARKRS